MPFDFEDFPVYKDTLKFIKEVDALIETLPARGTTRIIDQLQRAAMSISLNIAEGAGRFHKSDKRSFYVNARGSVYECAACFDVLFSKGLIDESKNIKFHDVLNDLAKQLSALIK
jgi:four helix bundle protein